MVGEVRFFESEPSQPRDGGERGEWSDEWWTRPALLLPSYLDSDFVVASTSEVAVVAHGIACYPTGFHFSLETVTRYADDHASDGEDYGDLFWSLRRGDELPPELLRFGVAYSDGQQATTLDAADAMDDFEDSASSERPGLRLCLGGGGGGGGRWSYKVWVSPLPPEGPVTFVCEWPAFDIEETYRELDGRRFIDAAANAKPIF